MSSEKTNAEYVIFVNHEFYDELTLTPEDIVEFAEERNLDDEDSVEFVKVAERLIFTVNRKTVMEPA